MKKQDQTEGGWKLMRGGITTYTTLMELFLVNQAAHIILTEKGVKISCNPVGELLTVQEMVGFQMCIARVDAEIKALWNAPSNAPFWVNRRCPVSRYQAAS